MITILRRLLKITVLAALFVAGLILFTVRPFVLSARDLSLSPKAQPARIRAQIDRLTTNWGPRSNDNPEKLAKIADDLVASLRATNSRVSLQSFFVGGIAFQSVLSEYGFYSGKGTVVIGAHYDSASGSPGADDNATGVAALLELNSLFADSPPPTKVILAFYPLEEIPLSRTSDSGSFIHASQLRQSKEPVRLMISMESIGYFSDTEGSQRYPLKPLSWVYPSVGKFLAVVGEASLSPATVDMKAAFTRATELPVESINAPHSLEGISFSDHRSFWMNGFDAVMLTDTAMFRNPNYHRPSDLPETVDPEKVAQVVDGVMEYLAALQ